MNKVEEVARVIDPDSWSTPRSVNVNEKLESLERAREVIRVMREPTTEMLEQIARIADGWGPFDSIWRRAIDAALNEMKAP